MSYFPMFVEIGNCPCLVIGGGKVALRKVEVLKDFGALITVIASEIIDEIKKIDHVTCVERGFVTEDLDEVKLVVAATDDVALNHIIAEECKARNIPVNAVDQIQDCSFIFPSYLKQGEVVAAFGSGGQSPLITQYLKKTVRPIMTNEIGELAQCLGSLRELVKSTVPEELRKTFYQEILSLGLEENEVPSEEKIRVILSRYQRKDMSWKEEED